MNFGEKLRALRKKRGLSQDQLAELIGLGSSTIGQYEINNREPNFERLKKIELDIVDLKEVLLKNYITLNGKKMSEEAKKGLIIFLENF